jgi:putative oxidoreductase
MKQFLFMLKTREELSPFLLRVLLAVVMFPHGAQKAFGWFGGYGFEGTMSYFTQTLHIPYAFGWLAIIAELFGPLVLAFGFLSRVAALGIGVTISTAALLVHLPNGFFMNWFGNQKGEGFEFHILMAAMAIAIMIQGGGKYSVDAWIYHNWTQRLSPKVAAVAEPICSCSR